MRFSKIIVAAVIGMNALFAIAVLAVFWHTGNEPVVLVGAWFAFTGTELMSLASLTKAKEKRRKGGDTNE